MSYVNCDLNCILFNVLIDSCLADPPSQPFIHGYTEGSHVIAGTVQKISCTSSGGNPLASLTWYKNDKKVVNFRRHEMIIQI